MSGRLISVLGVMGAGKTERLIRTYDECLKNGLSVSIYKPRIDTRTEDGVVRSRNGLTAPATTITRIDDIYLDEGDLSQVLLIDEIQFFDQPDVVNALVAITLLGIDIYCFGLDLTSDGTTFGRVGDIMAASDEVVKLSCICARCATNPSRNTAYLGGIKDSDVVVGDLDTYEHVCRDCFYAEELEDVFEDDDPLYFIEVGGKDLGFKMDIVTQKSSLDKAGYTYEDVLQVSTLEGAYNLMEDLGLIRQDGDDS